MTRLLVSIDVGGTLGHADGPSLATILATTSPLEPSEVRRIVRQALHTRRAINSAVVLDLCETLRIPVTAFPEVLQPPRLRLVPDTLTVLRSMSRYATLVTLSNVTCLEASTDQLRIQLHPWVRNHFPSYQIGYAKPDPSAFRYVAQACHANTADMVHIGDDWTCDVMGARSADVTAIWISNGRPLPEPERLSDRGIFVATDIAGAGRQLADLARWRQS